MPDAEKVLVNYGQSVKIFAGVAESIPAADFLFKLTGKISKGAIQ